MSGWRYDTEQEECTVKIITEIQRYIDRADAGLVMAECLKEGIGGFLYYQNKKEIENNSGMGIYLIIRDVKVKYIGTTDNLRTRIQKHDK